MSARDSVVDLTIDDFGAASDVHERQLEAATERLEAQRGRISALDARAREVGIERINHRRDLIPLLFAHSTYKSYPESFITGGKWALLTRWLSTVSTVDVSGVDVSDVGGVDEWIDRLGAAGISIMVSSGTSGKSSFLPMNADDVAIIRGHAVDYFGFPDPIEPLNQYPITMLGPSDAPMRFSLTFRLLSEAFGKPGHIRALTDEPVKVSDMMRATAIRKAMADGTATPGDITAFQSESRERTTQLAAALEDIAAAVLNSRDAPQILFGPLSMFWQLLTTAHALGLSGGGLHPDTLVMMGGGAKGMSLPDDYQEQLAAFLGGARVLKAYGMSELTGGFRACEAGVFHVHPQVILLMLDETGEQLLEPDASGVVTGRFAAFDIGWTGRWGGVVTGDRVTARVAGHCTCGRPGPTIEDSIVRYSELSAGGDDKLTCGGAIDAYIRGIEDS